MKKNVPILSIVFLVAVLALAGIVVYWEFQTMDPPVLEFQEPEPTVSAEPALNRGATNRSGEKTNTNANVNAAPKNSDEDGSQEKSDGDAEKPDSETVPAEKPLVRLTSNEEFTEFTITVDGTERATFETDGETDVSILSLTNEDVYIGLSRTGLGGYILYWGPESMYRLNFATDKLTKTVVEGFIADISSDGSMMAYIKVNLGDTVSRSVIVRNLEDESEQEFPVDEKYNQVGDAVFSPDGTKIAYGAAIGEPEGEAGVVIIINIESGEQTTAAETEDTYYVVDGWKDADTVDFTAQ
ncbi:MAG: hypothetical protein ABIG66_01240 [Candidatus Kerfeldbacteria bacterium]